MELKIKFKFNDEIKEGNYSAKYFLISQQILENANINHISTLRFKHFNDNVVVAGIEEVLQLIKFAIKPNEYEKLKIKYLPDGSITNNDQIILTIEGEYKKFGYLENIIDSILSRRSSIATNAHKVISLVGAKRVIYMGDRSDDYLLQPYDGYSAYIGGIRNFVSEASVKFLREANVSDFMVIGTIPHALIQQFEGNLANTLKAYANCFPNYPVVGLIDFHNDCLQELIDLKEAGITKLDYVRIDTSKKLVDKSLQKIHYYSQDKQLYGVNKYLIQKVRSKLDELGYQNTKIIISSSINAQIIEEFEREKIPVDIYGIGKYFTEVNVNYTGDLIKLNGKYLAKAGRDQNIDKYLQEMKEIE
ncbi:MAG: nicotinate phosphoribosyltransferase [Malacoplasma sp.]|nr:nicotinate phosphoribosyltransferase [Malacoplasma sp.]